MYKTQPVFDRRNERFALYFRLYVLVLNKMKWKRAAWKVAYWSVSCLINGLSMYVYFPTRAFARCPCIDGLLEYEYK